MTRFLASFGALILMFSTCGCATSEFPSDSSGPVSSESFSSAPSSSSSSTPSCVEAPIVGGRREDVDFLTDEQWALYDKGWTYRGFFLNTPGIFVEEDYYLPVNNTVVEINGYGYKHYEGEIYSSYADFYEDMLTVYTTDFFKKQNRTPGKLPRPPIYLDVEGELYYLDGSGGGNFCYLSNLDRFELVSLEDNRLEFNRIAYYCDEDDALEENPVPTTIVRCSVVMKKSDAGWRIDRFDDPIYLEEENENGPDLAQAEADMRTFLKAHPNVYVTFFERSDTDETIYIQLMFPDKDLTSFVEQYPMQDVYTISLYPKEDGINPD